MVESAMFILPVVAHISRLDHLEGKEAEGVVVTKLVEVIIIVMVVEMQVIGMLWDHFKDFNVKQIFYLFSLFPKSLVKFRHLTVRSWLNDV